MKAIRFVAQFVLEIAQWIVVAIGWPLQLTGWGFLIAHRFMMRWVYYNGIVLLKRRITGQPMWQEHDMKIGIMPPPEVQAKLEEQSRAMFDAMPRCETCGMAKIPGLGSGPVGIAP